MRRSSWLTISMAVFFAVPALRDCCLLPIVTHPSHCHESKQTKNELCYSNQEAAIETRNSFAFFPVVCGLPVSNDTDSGTLEPTHAAVNARTSVGAETPDLYLRTGALLI